MKIGFEYIKYRWKAKGRHGIHSPFVYDFVDLCLKKSISSEDSKTLNRLFKQLKNNSNVIEIEDFGAGSKKLGNFRSISTIFKTSSSKGRYGKLLYQLSKHYSFTNCLEFGTSLGIGAIHLALGNPNTTITTVEACENTRKVALENFSSFPNIHSIHSTFDEFISKNDQSILYDFVFIDGHHDGDALLRYIESLAAITHDETIYILDDIRWSDSMLNAWKKLEQSPQFHLTIDLFRVGLISKRPQQVKENFTLKK